MTVKSSWAAGDVLAAADLTDTFADKNNNKNLLYNGAMQVAQRGTSTASVTAASYNTADRWRASIGTLGTWTQSVESDAPTGSGLRKSLKMLVTTADASPAAGDYAQIDQLLEGQDVQRIAKGTASAQQLTLSFWVKSNVTGTYCVRLIDLDNSNRMVSAQYTVSASATWEKKTLTFAADTTGAFDNDNAASLGVAFWLAAGSNFTSGSVQSAWGAYAAGNEAPGQTNLAAATNNYWQVTGVQLEVGPVATSFEFKSYGQELLECQRYCVLIPTEQRLTIQQSQNSIISHLAVPVPMRNTNALTVSLNSNPTSANTILFQYPAAAYWYTFSTFTSVTVEASGINQMKLDMNFTGGSTPALYPQFGTFLRDVIITSEL